MNKLKTLMLAITSSQLIACGGGGGDSAVNTAEGLWAGVNSDGAVVQLAILENGEVWGGTVSNGRVQSAFAGTALGNGSSFSASGSEFIFATNSVVSGSYTGTVTQNKSITATSNLGVPLTVTYNDYYNQSISAAEIAGTYVVSGRTANFNITNLTVNINSSGNFTIVDNGCTTTGSATPRAAGKIIINITATGQGNCLLGSGVTLNGIGLLDKTTKPQSIYLIALNNSKTDGLILLGRKN